MWNAAITNAGAALLTRWAGGGTLTIDGASAGTGTVDIIALMTCTALAGEEHGDVQLVNKKAVEGGMRYDIQFTAVETAYTARQIGIWAHMNDETEKTLLAIFQSDTGIEVQSIAAMPNFVYSFKATLAISNSGEMITLTDSGALVCWADLQEALGDVSITLDNAVTENGANAVSGAAVWSFVHAAGAIPAGSIGAGTLAGRVNANAEAAAELNVAQVRNVLIGTEAMSEDILAQMAVGDIYYRYEVT